MLEPAGRPLMAIMNDLFTNAHPLGKHTYSASDEIAFMHAVDLMRMDILVCFLTNGANFFKAVIERHKQLV